MMINISKTRKDVLLDLLMELDTICKKNNLSYSITGNLLNEISLNKRIPEELNYITVVMTQGDIERFIAIVNNSTNTQRTVEYFMNNPKARVLQYRYCNNDTTLVNIKEINRHINFGLYIKLIPVDKKVESSIQSKLLKVFKIVWKICQKELSYFTPIKRIIAFFIKIVVTVFGKRRFAKLLYNFNKKIKYIHSWENIRNHKNVKIGASLFDTSSDWKIIEIVVDGYNFCYAEELIDRKIETIPKNETVLMNEIVDTTFSFNKFFKNKEVYKYLISSYEQRNIYLSYIYKARKYTREVNNAWNTYLMTRDVIDFRNYYDMDKIKEIQSYIDAGDFDKYNEEIYSYKKSQYKWNKLNIPFIKNEEVDLLIAKAESKFCIK